MGGGRQDPSQEALITHTLRGGGFDASEDGTDRGTPLIAIPFDTTHITHPENRSRPEPGDPSPSLAKDGHPPAIAFQARQDPISSDCVSPCLDRFSQGVGISERSSVRNITPREAERLMGFPDDYTLIKYRGKPAADGPRYEALGNSIAIPVLRWIGQRIQQVGV